MQIDVPAHHKRASWPAWSKVAPDLTPAPPPHSEHAPEAHTCEVSPSLVRRRSPIWCRAGTMAVAAGGSGPGKSLGGSLSASTSGVASCSRLRCAMASRAVAVGAWESSRPLRYSSCSLATLSYTGTEKRLPAAAEGIAKVGSPAVDVGPGYPPGLSDTAPAVWAPSPALPLSGVQGTCCSRVHCMWPPQPWMQGPGTPPNPSSTALTSWPAFPCMT